MITVKMMGGMGNQMFQFAFGLAQARRLGVGLQLDASHQDRPFSLRQWLLPNVPYAKMAPTVLERGMNYDQALVDSIKDGDVLRGYWQNERYFQLVEKELREIFMPSESPFDSAAFSQTVARMIDTHSVAVHVRRGDYLIEPHKSYHGVLDLGYYNQAFNEVYNRMAAPHFFIFSDDPQWVRQHFSGDNITMIEPGKEAEDMHLMSFCKHAIIANSSFSWWGAWLGDNRKDRVVISPEKWFDQANEDYSGIVPSRWVKV